jgi:hypothetical protein
MAPGKTRTMTPQDFLDDIFGELTFDPLDFVHIRTGETPAAHSARQIAMLRKTAKVDMDFEAIALENEKDYEARKLVNRDAEQLEARINGMTVLDGLPKNKLDEEAILKKLNAAGDANRQAQQVFQNRQELGAIAARLGIACSNNAQFLGGQKGKIEKLEEDLRMAKDALKAAEIEDKRISKEYAEAQRAYETAPTGEPIDVTALAIELQSAQRTNRAIDTRAEFDQRTAELKAKREESNKLTRQMEAREEKKKAALAKAKIPVEGLTFDERRVSFNGLPLENLGEAEQIRISAQIGMAANPKLKILCVRNGEALDEDGMKVLADLAEEYDFQIWMARVDSSGKVGIVLEDGMVIAENPSEPAPAPAAKKKAKGGETIQ